MNNASSMPRSALRMASVRIIMLHFHFHGLPVAELLIVLQGCSAGCHRHGTWTSLIVQTPTNLRFVVCGAAFSSASVLNVVTCAWDFADFNNGLSHNEPQAILPAARMFPNPKTSTPKTRSRKDSRPRY